MLIASRSFPLCAVSMRGAMEQVVVYTQLLKLKVLYTCSYAQSSPCVVTCQIWPWVVVTGSWEMLHVV